MNRDKGWAMKIKAFQFLPDPIKLLSASILECIHFSTDNGAKSS